MLLIQFRESALEHVSVCSQLNSHVALQLSSAETCSSIEAFNWIAELQFSLAFPASIQSTLNRFVVLVSSVADPASLIEEEVITEAVEVSAAAEDSVMEALKSAVAAPTSDALIASDCDACAVIEVDCVSVADPASLLLQFALKEQLPVSADDPVSIIDAD
jgi:hypothetical protein